MSQYPSFLGRMPGSDSSSRCKRSNRASGSRAEVVLCKELWAAGLRYRKNTRVVFGKPDVVFFRQKVAVFCDGDFWHGRSWPTLKRKLRRGFNGSYWTAKILRNRERDAIVTNKLVDEGWSVLRFWETDVLRNPGAAVDRVLDELRTRNP